MPYRTPDECKVLETVGRTIQALRKAKKMSAQELGRKSKLNGDTIASVESGRVSIKIEKAKRIADALNVKMEKLFEGVSDAT